MNSQGDETGEPSLLPMSVDYMDYKPNNDKWGSHQYTPGFPFPHSCVVYASLSMGDQHLTPFHVRLLVISDPPPFLKHSTSTPDQVVLIEIHHHF